MHIKVTFFIAYPFLFLGEIFSLYKMSESSFSSCSKEGDVKIWNKADPYNWRLSKKFHHHEKAVYSMVTIDNNQTMVTCSDDRKIHIVNLKTLGLDYSEIVDRSYISSLVRY